MKNFKLISLTPLEVTDTHILFNIEYEVATKRLFRKTVVEHHSIDCVCDKSYESDLMKYQTVDGQSLTKYSFHLPTTVSAILSTKSKSYKRQKQQ